MPANDLALNSPGAQGSSGSAASGSACEPRHPASSTAQTTAPRTYVAGIVPSTPLRARPHTEGYEVGSAEATNARRRITRAGLPPNAALLQSGGRRRRAVMVMLQRALL